MKRLLLDTHVLLWWLDDPLKIEESARQAIANPRTDVFVSVAAVWEMMIKGESGRLAVPEDPGDVLKRKRFTPLPVLLQHAVRAASLPLHHRDPFDRMMVAQAIEENLTLVTRDGKLAEYDAPTLAA